MANTETKAVTALAVSCAALVIAMAALIVVLVQRADGAPEAEPDAEPVGWCAHRSGTGKPYSNCERQPGACEAWQRKWLAMSDDGISGCHPVSEMWCDRIGICYATEDHCIASTNMDCERVP